MPPIARLLKMSRWERGERAPNDLEAVAVALETTAGEMLAPALAEATAVAETEGEAGGVAGVGAWPNAVKARAIELRQVKIVVFIGIFRSEMRSGADDFSDSNGNKVWVGGDFHLIAIDEFVF